MQPHSGGVLAIAACLIVGSVASPGAAQDRRTGVTLSAVLGEGGKPIEGSVWYTVYARGADRRFSREVATARGSRPEVQLRAGRYEVRAAYPYRRGPAVARQTFEVLDGQALELAVNLHAGTLVLSTILGAGGQPLSRSSWYRIEDADNREIMEERDARLTVPLTTGRYHVSVAHPRVDGPARAEAEVEIAENQRTEQVMNLHAGTLRLSTVLHEGAPPLARRIWYTVLAPEPDALGVRETFVGPDKDVDPSFILSAGTYRVEAGYSRAEQPAARATALVEVKENTVTEHTLDLRAGTYTLRCTRGGGRITGRPFYSLTEIVDGERTNPLLLGSETQMTVPLSEGRWLVHARYNEVEGESEIVARPGESREVVIPLE